MRAANPQRAGIDLLKIAMLSLCPAFPSVNAEMPAGWIGGASLPQLQQLAGS
jgi:hypothetical protein